MPTYTEAQIRAAIETLVKNAAPTATVFPWWILGHDSKSWPGLLKSSSESGKVHGFVITREQTDGERLNPQCVKREFNYSIWGFHWYDTGTRASNTDVAFNAEVDAICDAFIARANLPLELGRSGVPQFRVDLGQFGGELLHYAIGRLTVEQQ